MERSENLTIPVSFEVLMLVVIVILFIASIVADEKRKALVSHIENGKPVECKGILITRPALHRENGKIYVKTESGVLINISYCKKP